MPGLLDELLWNLESNRERGVNTNYKDFLNTRYYECAMVLTTLVLSVEGTFNSLSQ